MSGDDVQAKIETDSQEARHRSDKAAYEGSTPSLSIPVVAQMPRCGSVSGEAVCRIKERAV